MAVVFALGLVLLGAAGAPNEDGGVQDLEERPADIEVIGASEIPALAGDNGAFASALSDYLKAEGNEARTAAVVCDPENPESWSFFASVGGNWYECEVVDGVSGWAFAALGSESPVSPRVALEVPETRGLSRSDPAPAEVSATSPTAPSETGSGAASRSEIDAGSWVPLADDKAVAEAVGPEASGKLGEALHGYAVAKGIGYDSSKARLDVSSVRSEPGGVGFMVDTGSSKLDVVYTDGAFGFLVL